MIDYDSIRKQHGAEDALPRMFVRRGKHILALCLRADQHPRINARPAEVWIEHADHMQEWSNRLAFDTGALLVYVASGPGCDYRSRGVYHVLGSSDDPVELACRTAESAGDRLARIIFLSGPHRR